MSASQTNTVCRARPSSRRWMRRRSVSTSRSVADLLVPFGSSERLSVVSARSPSSRSTSANDVCPKSICSLRTAMPLPNFSRSSPPDGITGLPDVQAGRGARQTCTSSPRPLIGSRMTEDLYAENLSLTPQAADTFASVSSREFAGRTMFVRAPRDSNRPALPVQICRRVPWRRCVAPS